MADQQTHPPGNPAPEPPVRKGSSGSGNWPAAVMVVLLVAVLAGTAYWRNSQSPSAVTGPDGSSPIPWQHDFNAALTQAQQESKPLYISFHASWCPPCRMMAKDVYTQQQAADVLDGFIAVSIDIDEHNDIAQKFNVASIPTSIVVAFKPHGDHSHPEVVRRMEGYKSLEQFVATITAVRAELGMTAPDADATSS